MKAFFRSANDATEWLEDALKGMDKELYPEINSREFTLSTDDQHDMLFAVKRIPDYIVAIFDTEAEVARYIIAHPGVGNYTFEKIPLIGTWPDSAVDGNGDGVIAVDGDEDEDEVVVVD